MSGDWPRLGRYVHERRTELRMTQLDVQKAGGPSDTKVREIENGRAGTLSTSKRRDLERALHWLPGTVDKILDGGTPAGSDGSGDTGPDGLELWLELEDRKYRASLVQKRIEARLTREDVAHAMGRSGQAILQVEDLNSDPHLSTLRRYAAAVGALVDHRVFRWIEPEPDVTEDKQPATINSELTVQQDAQ